jgi:nucleotide-binding universal stress UspA family protein
MFKNILLPVDGSEHALKAVDTGIQLAAKLGSTVFGIHVLPPLSTVSLMSELLQHRPCYSEAAQTRANAFLDEIVQRAKAAGVPCETEIACDLRPYVAIVAAAVKHRCDLIVMRARGQEGVERLLLGSVPHKVMLSCDIPVLVCH